MTDFERRRTHGLLATYTTGACRCAECREAARCYGVAYRARNVESVRRSKRQQDLRRRYGLTVEQADSLLAEGCAVCSEPAEHIDHDHGSGAVRGGLCAPCNKGLSFFRDTPARLRAAADYLEAHLVRL